MLERCPAQENARSKVLALREVDVLAKTLLIVAFLSSSLPMSFTPAAAEETLDKRIVLVHPDGNSPINLLVVPQRAVMVLLPTGNRIASILVGDAQVLRVDVPESQDGLVINVVRPGVAVSVTVHTVSRTYVFDVSSSTSAPPTWVFQVEGGESPPAIRVWTPPPLVASSRYRVSGKKALFPRSIRDDGSHVFIEWSADKLLPAVFGVSAQGMEEMVDGYMRSGTFVIDRVYPALVFRIARSQAKARREIVKAKQ